MIIPNVIVLVQQSGLLGRFNFDFSDSSSETRLTAFECLSFYSFNDKIIIMLAIWGVASLNNNMTYIMLLSFFLLANIFLNTENHCGMKIKNIFFLFKK